MYLSFHSFGQKILYPWSHTSKPIPDWKDLDRMAHVMSEAIFHETGGRDIYRVILKKFFLKVGFLLLSSNFRSDQPQRSSTWPLAAQMIGWREKLEQNGYFCLSFLIRAGMPSFFPEGLLFQWPNLLLPLWGQELLKSANQWSDEPVS